MSLGLCVKGLSVKGVIGLGVYPSGNCLGGTRTGRGSFC